MAIIQAVAFPSIVAYPTSAVLPSNVTPGNTLVAIFTHNYPACPPSVSDNLGNAWSGLRGTQLQNAGVMFALEVFDAPVTVAGACTVTFAASCGGMHIGVVAEVSGLVSAAYDGENNLSNTASPLSCGGVSTSQPGDLLIGLFLGSASGAADVFTPTGGAAQLVATITARGDEAFYRYASGGAGVEDITCTGTGGPFSTNPVDGHMAAFKALVAGVVLVDRAHTPQHRALIAQ